MDVKDTLLSAVPPQGRQREMAQETDQPEAERELRQVAPGFYVSPLLKFDTEISTLIFQVRDGVSGEVERQFPSESRLEILKHSSSRREVGDEEDDKVAEANATAVGKSTYEDSVTSEIGLKVESPPNSRSESDVATDMVHGAAANSDGSGEKTRVDVTV